MMLNILNINIFGIVWMNCVLCRISWLGSSVQFLIASKKLFGWPARPKEWIKLLLLQTLLENSMRNIIIEKRSVLIPWFLKHVFYLEWEAGRESEELWGRIASLVLTASNTSCVRWSQHQLHYWLCWFWVLIPPAWYETYCCQFKTPTITCIICDNMALAFLPEAWRCQCQAVVLQHWTSSIS